uniref:Uncharacterized protein n=1 Tax=Arundo donax TaxID=35708 RepID=A0A0A8YL38_ARUDO
MNRLGLGLNQRAQPMSL